MIGTWQVCSALMNGDSGQHGGTEEPLVVQAAALWPGGGVQAQVEKGPVPASALRRNLPEPGFQ